MAEVDMVDADPKWRMPRRGSVKINAHGCFFATTLPDGNVTGIGLAMRNIKGRILLSGSLEIQNRRINEYYAMLEGYKRAYVKDWHNFTLETDHEESYWEWRNSSGGSSS